MKRLVRNPALLPAPVRRVLRRFPGAYAVRDRSFGRPAGPPASAGGPRPVVHPPTFVQWRVMRQRPQELISALGNAGHPAYFVDPALDGPVRDGAVVLTPDFLGVPRYAPVLYLHHAPTRRFASLFEDPVIVYDVLDDLAVYRGGERLLAKRYRSAEQHHRLLDEAHVVTASSHVLADQIREARPDVIVVENGVDARRFTPQATRPADLPIDRPLIGFHGAIERWFNFELLFEVARRRPDWLFVNVGPIGSDVAKEVEYTGTLPNITFLGERSSDAIPGYVAAFDVEVIWFIVNDLTRAVSPLKVFEALAAGTPCVAPPLPACEALPIVHIGSTADEVAAAVVRAFDDRDGFLRSVAAVVAEAAWGERIRPLLDRLDELGSRSVPS